MSREITPAEKKVIAAAVFASQCHPKEDGGIPCQCKQCKCVVALLADRKKRRASSRSLFAREFAKKARKP